MPVASEVFGSRLIEGALAALRKGGGSPHEQAELLSAAILRHAPLGLTIVQDPVRVVEAVLEEHADADGECAACGARLRNNVDGEFHRVDAVLIAVLAAARETPSGAEGCVDWQLPGRGK